MSQCFQQVFQDVKDNINKENSLTSTDVHGMSNVQYNMLGGSAGFVLLLIAWK